jgi:hypothetical protein
MRIANKLAVRPSCALGEQKKFDQATAAAHYSVAISFFKARATAAHSVWNNCVIVNPAIYLGAFIRWCLFAECLRKLELQELGTCARASHSLSEVQLSQLNTAPKRNALVAAGKNAECD